MLCVQIYDIQVCLVICRNARKDVGICKLQYVVDLIMKIGASLCQHAMLTYTLAHAHMHIYV